MTPRRLRQGTLFPLPLMNALHPMPLRPVDHTLDGVEEHPTVLPLDEGRPDPPVGVIENKGGCRQAILRIELCDLAEILLFGHQSLSVEAPVVEPELVGGETQLRDLADTVRVRELREKTAQCRRSASP